jgi:uncharacterized spore protein YtfJ
MAETSSKERLTEKLAAGVTDRGVKLAVGEKQTVDGVELVPVALVAYGFGAGDTEEYGSGGGGGGSAIPLGAYIGGPMACGSARIRSRYWRCRSR